MTKKNVWKTVKPLFSEQGPSADYLTLLENNTMVDNGCMIAEIFNDFFINAVKNLDIEYYEHFSFDKNFLTNESEETDPISKAIRKYENHPSILKIK